MKKSILRTFAVIVALLIFCQSLTVGFITSADNISNIPERYPQRTVYKFENVIDYKSGAPSSEETTVRLSSPVNFTSADYDNLEFDLFVESELKSLPFKMGVFDSQGKTAVFAADADTGFWLHISIATANFAASNTDLTDICGCMIVDPQKDTRYVVANICLTGIARTAEWPDADLQKLSARIDLTDDDKKSTSSAIIRFDDLEQVDLLKSDWLEFDIYVAGIRADSIDSVQTLAFVDKDQTDGLSFGKNSARYNKFTVKTNTWSHIKVPTRDLTIHATCDTTQIIGVQIRDMTDNYRYVLTNLCLSTKNTTPPPMPENAQVIKSGIFTEYFCDKQGDETPLYDAPQVFDLTKREHIRFDILADTVKATEHNLNFIITDKNGLKATYEFVFKPGNWVSVKALVKALNAEDGFDFTACKSVNVAGIEQNARYFIANLCQTSADIDIPDNDYPNNASKKFNDFSVDYFTGNSADAKEGTYFSFDKTDLRENSYIEFDMFVDTGLDSSPLPKKIALYFVDENSRRFKATANYEYNKAGHARVLISGLSAVDANADLSGICGVYLADEVKNSRYVIKNLCFTDIIAPEPVTKNAVEEVIHFGRLSAIYNVYTLSNLFDGLDPDNIDDVVDLTKGDYVEFDIYVIMDENREDYIDTHQLSLSLGDKVYYDTTHQGRSDLLISGRSNEWTHIKVPLERFDNGGGKDGVMSEMRRYFIGNNSSVKADYIIANFTICKRTVPDPDPETMPSTPDKDSQYVSDCDTLNTVGVGVWSSSNSMVTQTYKTEGKGSVALRVQNQEVDSLNAHKFLFNSVADLSKSKSVRFDLFVDDKALFDQCETMVYFSAGIRYSDNTFTYKIKNSDVKLGWNSFDIPLSAFGKKGDVNWSSIMAFALETVIKVPFEDTADFKEYYMLGIDNLRINKSYVLKEDTEETETPPALDSVPQTQTPTVTEPSAPEVYYEYTDILVKLDPQESIKHVNKQIVKKQKVYVDEMANIRLIFSVITISAAALLLAANTVVIIITRKRIGRK